MGVNLYGVDSDGTRKGLGKPARAVCPVADGPFRNGETSGKRGCGERTRSGYVCPLWLFRIGSPGSLGEKLYCRTEFLSSATTQLREVLTTQSLVRVGG